MKSRDGEVRAQVVESVGATKLQPLIQASVAAGSTVYTDSWCGYNGLKNYLHTVVNHSCGVYVDGVAHTNGIESFWALFKRGYHGIYHHMSKKHLQRYVNEFTFRVNRRTLTMQNIFSELVTNAAETAQFKHTTVDHMAKKYVNGDCHTNGIESFWALFKRGYHGIYHHMSRKHLQRYVNEFTFRFNRRASEMQSIFSEVVNNIAETAQLPYKALTQQAL